jgi:hypothetical protein
MITRDSTDWTWSSGTSTCVATNVITGRKLIESVVVPTGSPLFVYTNRTGGSVATADITQAPNDGGTAAVRVNLVLRYQARNTPDLTLNSNAVLRNDR